MTSVRSKMRCELHAGIPLRAAPAVTKVDYKVPEESEMLIVIYWPMRGRRMRTSAQGSECPAPGHTWRARRSL